MPNYANRHGFSKHKPALPLYTEEDARAVLTHLAPIPSNRIIVCPAAARSGFDAPVISWSGFGTAGLGRNHDCLLRRSWPIRRRHHG